MVKSGLDHKNFEGPSDVPRVSQYRLVSATFYFLK